MNCLLALAIFTFSIVEMFLLQMLSVYRPKGLKVIGAMSLVRNSVGSGLSSDFCDNYLHTSVHRQSSPCVCVCPPVPKINVVMDVDET